VRLIKSLLAGLFYLIFGLLFIVGLSIVIYIVSIPGVFKALYRKPKKPKPTVDPALLGFQGREN
jgi:hypothetical protein